jgi:ABC-type branched-subunit amino acid transport system substrate-binding protein
MRRNRALARACSRARRLPAVLAAAATGLVTVAAVVAPTATTTAGAATKGTVNFDAVMDLTGTYGQYGGYQLAGDKAIIALLNKSGGINGKKIVLHYEDDQSNASTAALDAQQLLQQYPAIVMDSGTITPTCNAVLPVTTKAKVISFCSGQFLQSQFPYAFSLIPTSTLFGAAEDSALKTLGAKKVATITDQSSGDLTDTKIASDNAPKYGLTSVAYITTPTGATDYTAALQQAKNAGAQAVFLSSVVASSVVAFMRDLQTLGWTTVKILVNDESVGTSVMTNIPAAVEKQFYAVAPRIYLNSKTSKNQLLTNFAQQLASQGPITDIGISAYHGDAVNLAKYAMTKAKTTTTMQKVMSELEGTSKANIPVGQFLAYQNPQYTKADHALPASAMTDYWALIRPGTPQTGRYKGTPITVKTP